MICTQPRKGQKGQVRILEAVIAAVILLLTFSVASIMVQSSNVKVVQEKGDLDRLGYNVLSIIAESGGIDSSQTNLTITTTLQANLPPSIYYSFTILNWSTASNSLVPYLTVSNTASFINATEISSTSTMYTSSNGQIRQLLLQLARAGES